MPENIEAYNEVPKPEMLVDATPDVAALVTKVDQAEKTLKHADILNQSTVLLMRKYVGFTKQLPAEKRDNKKINEVSIFQDLLKNYVYPLLSVAEELKGKDFLGSEDERTELTIKLEAFSDILSEDEKPIVRKVFEVSDLELRVFSPSQRSLVIQTIRNSQAKIRELQDRIKKLPIGETEKLDVQKYLEEYFSNHRMFDKGRTSGTRFTYEAGRNISKEGLINGFEGTLPEEIIRNLDSFLEMDNEINNDEHGKLLKRFQAATLPPDYEGRIWKVLDGPSPYIALAYGFQLASSVLDSLIDRVGGRALLKDTPIYNALSLKDKIIFNDLINSNGEFKQLVGLVAANLKKRMELLASKHGMTVVDANDKHSMWMEDEESFVPYVLPNFRWE